MGGLTHIDDTGAARMVDVGDKDETVRVAEAEATVSMSGETLRAIVDGNVKKGDVLGTARIAGIMAAKRTADLVPLCHPIALSAVEVTLSPREGAVHILSRARCEGRTGVEMEALMAASVAALTVYDMAKALDREMEIGSVRLVSKSGGKSGDWQRG